MFLQKVLKTKRDEIQHMNESHDSTVTTFRICKNFRNCLLNHKPVALIAEIKKRSPALGDIAIFDDPRPIVDRYREMDAAAISVLTDATYFNGSFTLMKSVSDYLKDSAIAVLCKDFIIDKIQVDCAYQYGADAVLLIASVLQDKLADVYDYTYRLGMQEIVEVHHLQDLTFVLNHLPHVQMIGVNNRDLNTLIVDNHHASTIKPYIPDHIVTVAESGITSLDDVKATVSAGFNAVLVGTSLMTKQLDGVGHEF